MNPIVLIDEVEIDAALGLLLRPRTPPSEDHERFSRKASEVRWQPQARAYTAPEAKGEPPTLLFPRIVTAVDREYGVVLQLHPKTCWTNVSERDRDAISLDALEVDTRALEDSEERDFALKSIADLRAAQADFETRRKAGAFAAPRTLDFRNFGLVRLVKLVLGAFAFLALCASLIFLVLPVGELLGGDRSTGTFMLLSIALCAVGVSAVALYLLGRKSPQPDP